MATIDDVTQLKPLFPEDRPTAPEPQVAPQVRIPTDPKVAADHEVAGMVEDRFESSKTWRRQWRMVWDKCWQHIKGQYDKTGKAQWQSTTFQPITSKVCEVIIANLHAALLGPDVPIEWQSRRSDMDQNIRSINEIIGSDLDKCQAKLQLTDFIRSFVYMGTAIGAVDYIKQQETVMIKERQDPSAVDPMLQSLGLNVQREVFLPKQMLVKDFARIRNVDLYDIYPQPRVQDINKDSWIIEQGTITNKELLLGSKDADPYYKLDNVTNDLLEGSGLNRVDQDPEKQVRRFAMLDYQTFAHYLDPDREHNLKTFYGQIPLSYLKPELKDSRKYESVPGWIQVVDGQWVIRKRISPWRDGEPPYFKGNYIRLPNEFYGIGVAELVIGLQIEKNEIRNSRMDNINLSLNKIMAVIKDMVPPTEWQRLKSEPGALWLFKGIDDVRKAVQVVEFGDVTKDSWMASQEVDREIQETTGAVKATIGVGGGGDQAGGNTFRGQLLNAQAAGERFMLYARSAEWSGFLSAFRKFYHRIYQFKSYEEAANILGPDRAKKFKFLSPEELDEIARLVPMGAMSLENKGVKLAQLNQFAQMWMPFPFLKKLELARRMWVESGNQEPDQVLFSDEEQEAFNAFQQQMMGSMGGGMPTPQPTGLLGPNGQPLSPPNQPVAGDTSYPMRGVARPARPAQGPGSSPVDMVGRPLS